MLRDLLIAFVLVFIAAATAAAQTTLHYREGQRVDPEDVRSILLNGDQPTGRTRSIRLLADGAAPAKVAATGHESSPSALSLPVQFAFDSATILPAAREQLDALAAGIRMLPVDRKVVIEGHTDATGPEAYNDLLSRRRAAAVKAYLVESCGIDGQRLLDTGYGERQPIAGSDPYAAENRRVQFRGG